MNILKKILSKINVEKKYHCPVCNDSISDFERLPDFYLRKFDEVQFIHSIFQLETLNIFNYTCPKCGACDRDRLNALYFKKFFKNNVYKPFNFLDIAPSKPLQKFLKINFKNIVYRSADLMMEGVDDKIDITNMHIYEDEKFDFFICSHVLEHVIEDRKALKELYRILKTGGQGIIMVPILLSLSEDFENYDIKSDDERWKYFGQNDHVRMYSKNGFISKVKSAGFSITELNKDSFSEELFRKSGIHPRSVLYVVTK